MRNISCLEGPDYIISPSSNPQENRLLVTMPKLGLGSHLQEAESLRKVCGQDLGLLVVERTGGKLVGEYVTEIRGKLERLSGNEQVNLGLLGICYGGFVALSLATDLARNPIGGVKLESVLLLTPIVDDQSAKKGFIAKLKNHPRDSAVNIIKPMITAWSFYETHKKGRPQPSFGPTYAETYCDLMREVYAPGGYRLPSETRLGAFLVEHDYTITKERVRESLERLNLGSRLTYVVMSRKVREFHEFNSKSSDWEFLATAHLGPYLKGTFASS